MKKTNTTAEVQEFHDVAYEDKGLQYTIEASGNGSGPSYQEVSGAPVESVSPLGTHAGLVSVMFLSIGKMIGTGIFSTPGSILDTTGSVGLSLFMWVIGYVKAMSGVSVYLEFASYFPNRSGSEAVYLEQSFPRPKYFFPAAYAASTVILSFSSANAIVLAEYLFRLRDYQPSDWQLKGVAMGGYTVAVMLVAFNTKYSYWLSNVIGVIKVLTLVFICITGLIILGGHTSVPNPGANFRNAFEGTNSGGYGVTNALVKVSYAYSGYENAFNVVNEVENPIKTLRRSAPLAVTLVAVLFVLVNIAFFAAVPKEDIRTGNVVVAGLFFEAVFGKGTASRALNFLVALSSFGALLVALIGTSRMIRECGRQGVLPFPRFWASTRPFGTPLGPYFVKWLLTMIMIVAPPAGDAFNFVTDLAVYPSAFFVFVMGVGLYMVRRRRARIGLPRPEYRSWHVMAVLFILINFYLLAMPWYPPPEGRYGGDVSFWYATYVVVGIGIIILCGIYYVIWITLLPRWRGYRIRQKVLVLDNGAVAQQLVKVPLTELATWDSIHDATGRKLETD